MTPNPKQLIEFLPTLSDVLTQANADWIPIAQPQSHQHAAARELQRHWQCAIATVASLLYRVARFGPQPAGLIVSGSIPILSEPDLLDRFANWILTANRSAAQLPGQFPTECAINETEIVPLLSSDPLSGEQFCLVLTPQFSLAMALKLDADNRPIFQFSFDPETIETVWDCVRSRIHLTQPHALRQIDSLVAQFDPIAPHYKTVMRFSQVLQQQLLTVQLEDAAATRLSLDDSKLEGTSVLPALAADRRCPKAQVKPDVKSEVKSEETPPDVELLQAIAHEVRTPLSTIRTFTRLLLKRQDLPPDALKWLDMIDRECSEQIDRFGLIFKAVEMETSQVKKSSVHLTSTCLEEVIRGCIPRWQKQASRRGLKLDIDLPQTMPQVVSDPTMLDQVLTGAIENLTSRLSMGSHLQVQVIPAGDRLKVKLKSCTDCPQSDRHSSALKAVGHLLMFQPETGNLSLNLAVTKNLFQALGGKLIVRNRPHQGEELTIFLPLK